MKRCVRCKKFKKLTEFSKNRQLKDGLDCYCKECKKEIRPYVKTRDRELKSPGIDKTLSDKCMCRILTYHHSIMDDDNERLSTQFIVDVIRHKI